VRDLFDEFMDELRRRREQAEGTRPVGDDRPSGDQEPGGGGDEPPRPIRPVGGGPNDGGVGFGTLVRRFMLGIVIVAIVLLVTVSGVGVDLWTDAIWFRSVGFDGVFWTRLGTQVLLFAGVAILAGLVLVGNVLLAGRLAARHPAGPDGTGLGRWRERLAEATRDIDTRGWDGAWSPRGQYPGRRAPIEVDAGLPDPSPLGLAAIAVVGALIVLGLAGAATAGWETFLLWRNQVPFAPAGSPPVTDPVFGRDIGFFLFELPFLRLVQSIANGLILGSLILAAGRYLLAGLRDGLELATPIRVHLGVLAALFLVSIAAGYQLDKFELAYSSNGVAAGVSYTDQAARFLALDVLSIIAAIAAAFLVGGAATGLGWPLAGAVGVWLAASVLLGGVYPEIVQRFVVAPNPFANEQPYISNNIAMTRLAYGLDTWTTTDFSGEAPLTADKIAGESATFQNARLWDYRPLHDTLAQLQKVRQYYDFVDVDTDRYAIGGSERQVMLSARELASEQIPNAANWLNERIIYTHGFGLAMVPVNEVVGQGQPQLFIYNLPPVSADGAPTVTQPRIYFGERPTGYVITGARQAEFDYPAGFSSTAPPVGPAPSVVPSAPPSPSATPSTISGASDQAFETRWTGTTGIGLDTTLARLLWAARFRDLNLLISDQITADSQLLLHRSLADRLGRIAPFLSFDKDPYLVVTADGRLVWVQDAYTTSDRFPHAQPYDQSALPDASGLRGAGAFNYIRNSVKITVDAYDGTTTFYAADPSDPILRAYEGVFPGLFHSLSDMPADLRAHLRTPEELFDVQTNEYGVYHVTNPLVFFSGDDLWTVPEATASDQVLPNESYYVVMRLPGESDAEFLLLQPMIPAKRPNMIAWVAARNDPGVRGEVRSYQFPADTTIFGPAQVEALIDQDPTISAQVTLWNQSGSNVVRGNLIVIPVRDSLLYLQPVYLQSTGSSFPAFQRIIVASPQKVVWASTLSDALNLLLAGGPGPTPTPSPSGGPSAGPSATPSASPPSSGGPLPSDVAGLVLYANTHFETAQSALRAGDFARYGAEMALVRQALSQLSVLTSSGAPGTSASPSPAP
jgi:uncharacterized membrane protein (UPF0182 family)